MKKLYFKTLNYLTRLESKIAFYPTLLSFGGVIFALLMYWVESAGISGFLIKNAPILINDDIDTARLILSAFIGGLISIMVFSFSMVMILLNNASSNFSPRVLPGIISNKRHQVILGVFNASLLYCIFTLISIDPIDKDYQLPGFSVLISIVSMIFCLGMFIYFIHSISQEIQVNNVMRRIYFEAKNRLEKLLRSEKPLKENFPETSNWNPYYSNRSGYFQELTVTPLKRISKEKELKITIIPIQGDYIFEGDLLYKSNKELDEETRKEILSNFIFSADELVEENYILGFKQITEIAVKAMSPGINDPGTCVNAIDYLTELFLLRMQKSDCSYVSSEDEPLIEIATANFKVILYGVMASLRTYIAHDIVINNKLISMLKVLIKSPNSAQENFRLAILMEIDNLYQDVLKNINNDRDIKIFEKRMEEVKGHLKM